MASPSSGGTKRHPRIDFRRIEPNELDYVSGGKSVRL